MKIYYIGASTCILDIDNKIKIGIDPAISPINHKINFKSFESIRTKAPKYQASVFENIDVWLITHSHEDHVDSLGKEKTIGSKIICDIKSASLIFADRKTITLKWKQEYKFIKEGYSVTFTAIPAYHGNSVLTRTLTGKVNGYLVKVDNGICIQTIYFTGDTVYHKKILQYLPQNINVLIANLGNVKSNLFGGPLTMNLSMLKKILTYLQVDKVIPIHIDDYSHYETSISEVKSAGLEILPLGKWIDL